MDIHELKLLDFADAVDLLENRLVDVNRLIEDNKDSAPSQEAEELAASRAEAETRLAQLRELKTAEMSGESDNLLTEVGSLLDQIGERISDLFPKGPAVK